MVLFGFLIYEMSEVITVILPVMIFIEKYFLKLIRINKMNIFMKLVFYLGFLFGDDADLFNSNIDKLNIQLIS